MAGDGKIYFCNVGGETTVLAAGREYRALSTNPLHESVQASFAIAGERLFVRGEKTLFCIERAP